VCRIRRWLERCHRRGIANGFPCLYRDPWRT
jgi:hypothetical protein